MAILSVQVDDIGQTGIKPGLARIDTDDTLATVLAAGYLNKLADQYALSDGKAVLVSTKTSPAASSTQVGLMQITKSGDTYSLTQGSDRTVVASHVVVYAGQPTTVGGAAAEAITVTGALATDLAFVQMVDDGTNNVTIVDAVVTADTLTVTFSADPGNDAIINYQLLRAAA